MPVFNCDATPGLKVVNRPESCAKKESITQAAWFRTSEVDSAAIPTTTDACGATIVTGFPMLGGATMYKLNIDSETTAFNSTYSSDNGYYEWSLTTDFTGFTAEQIEAFCEAEALCDIGIWIRVGCKEVILGLTFNNGVFEANYRGEITDHNISFGGENDSVNSITIGGKSDCAATCSDIGYTNLPIDETVC